MTDPDSPPNPPVDSLAKLLEHPHRRAALAHLAGRRAPVGLHALARQLLESVGTSRGEGSVVDVESVAIALHHNHLPRLADSGLVEYDVERRTVSVPRVDDRVQAGPEPASPAESLLDRWRRASDSVDRLP